MADTITDQELSEWKAAEVARTASPLLRVIAEVERLKAINITLETERNEARKALIEATRNPNVTAHDEASTRYGEDTASTLFPKESQPAEPSVPAEPIQPTEPEEPPP